MNPNKRDLLLALAALGAGAVVPVHAQTAAFHLSAGRAIGEAYRIAYPDENFEAMRRDLPSELLSADILARLRRTVAEDFRLGNLFVYEGWRLSRTEGRLFALLAHS